jgi:hypothetical protein
MMVKIIKQTIKSLMKLKRPNKLINNRDKINDHNNDGKNYNHYDDNNGNNWKDGNSYA